MQIHTPCGADVMRNSLCIYKHVLPSENDGFLAYGMGKFGRMEISIVMNSSLKFCKPKRERVNESERIIHAQFVRYGRNAREWLKKCALLLPRIEEKQIWRKKGFSSIYEYCAKLAGMSHASVDEALRVLRKIEDKPELLHIVETHGIQRVRPIATIATADTAAFWAEKARDMSKNTLETYVRDYRRVFLPREKIQGYKKTAEPRKTAAAGAPDRLASPQKEHIEMELDSEIAQKLLKLKGAEDWNTLMKKLLTEREEKLEQEKPQPIATKSRHIPAAVKNHAIEKTNGQCAYPGCVKPYEILHHTQRFALEKTHDPDRLMPLCKEHERIAHLGLIDHEEKAPEDWRLRRTHDPMHHKRQIDQMVWLYR